MNLSLASLCLRAGSLLGLLLMLPIGLPATVCFSTEIQHLILESDAIVVGRITAIEPSSDISGRFSVQVVRIVDGSVDSGPLTVDYSNMATPVAGTRPSLAGRLALMFLTRADLPGGLELISLRRCSSGPSMLSSHLLFNSDGGVAVALAPVGDENTMQRIVRELAVFGAGQYLQALADLSIELPTHRRLALQMMGSPDLRTIEMGLARLVGLDELDGLVALNDAILTGRHEHIVYQSYNRVRHHYSDTHLDGIAILARWLDPANPQERRLTAAIALGRLRTMPAIRALASSLRDLDELVRWYALAGLMAFAEDGSADIETGWPFASNETRLYSSKHPDSYRKNEALYLDFWRAWWIENRASVEAHAIEHSAP